MYFILTNSTGEASNIVCTFSGGSRNSQGRTLRYLLMLQLLFSYSRCIQFAVRQLGCSSVLSAVLTLRIQSTKHLIIVFIYTSLRDVYPVLQQNCLPYESFFSKG